VLVVVGACLRLWWPEPLGAVVAPVGAPGSATVVPVVCGGPVVVVVVSGGRVVVVVLLVVLVVLVVPGRGPVVVVVGGAVVVVVADAASVGRASAAMSRTTPTLRLERSWWVWRVGTSPPQRRHWRGGGDPRRTSIESPSAT
jgi:hypothetical protein